MGMFDTIRVEYPLPLPKDMGGLTGVRWEEITFQTKDLQNALQDYFIDSKGQLWLERVDRKYDFSKGYGPSEIKVDEVKLEPERCGYYGVLEFYTTEYRDKNDYLIEFSAKVDDGKIVDLELDNYEVCDNADRKETNQRLEEQMTIHKNRCEKTWYKVYSKTWVPAVRVVTRSIEKTGKTLVTASHKLRRKLTPY